MKTKKGAWQEEPLTSRGIHLAGAHRQASACQSRLEREPLRPLGRERQLNRGNHDDPPPTGCRPTGLPASPSPPNQGPARAKQPERDKAGAVCGLTHTRAPEPPEQEAPFTFFKGASFSNSPQKVFSAQQPQLSGTLVHEVQMTSFRSCFP